MRKKILRQKNIDVKALKHIEANILSEELD